MQWRMESEMLSPRHATRCADLPTVK
ncbi:TPA: DUF4113 domain-containing protein [Enterobacter cloacae]|nr:DUF4113 domain-containing protein [Enterobacter pasteurii]